MELLTRRTPIWISIIKVLAPEGRVKGQTCEAIWSVQRLLRPTPWHHFVFTIIYFWRCVSTRDSIASWGCTYIPCHASVHYLPNSTSGPQTIKQFSWIFRNFTRGEGPHLASKVLGDFILPRFDPLVLVFHFKSPGILAKLTAKLTFKMWSEQWSYHLCFLDTWSMVSSWEIAISESKPPFMVGF